METTMLTYIQQTPKQLETLIKNHTEYLAPLVNCYHENIKEIWLIACGSSNNAVRCALPFMEEFLPCTIKLISPMTFIYQTNKIPTDVLTVVISQSGCSTNAIAALDKIRSLDHQAIGLTANVNSDFKDHADTIIDYGAGEETVAYVTKGVVLLAAYLMLFALEAALKTKIISKDKYDIIMEEFNSCPLKHKLIQEETQKFYKKYYKSLTSIQTVYFCGFLQAYGIASEAALKFGETIQVPSFAYEPEEMIHGPNLQLTPNYTVFFVDDFSNGSKRIQQICHSINEITDHTFIVTNKDESNCLRIPFEPKIPLITPLYLLPIFQILAFNITDDLHRWHKHPLFSKFKDSCATKTKTIDEIMPNNNEIF